MVDDQQSAPDHEPVPENDRAENEIGTEMAEANIIAEADDPDAVTNAIARHKEAARKAKQERDELAARVAQFEGDKTEQQKLAERAAQYERELRDERHDKLRLAVAVEKGLVGEKAELAARLQGETKEELAADADKLLALFGQQRDVSFDGGARGTPAKADGFDGIIRQAAHRS